MDIVDRLRDHECANCGHQGVIADEAADEIERLREALEWALNHIGGHCRYDNAQQVVNCLEKAHDALNPGE